MMEGEAKPLNGLWPIERPITAYVERPNRGNLSLFKADRLTPSSGSQGVPTVS